MSRQIRRLSFVFALLMVAVLVNITLIQVVNAGDYRDRPGNQRILLAEYDRERGPILVGNDPVARSVETGGTLKFLRTYSNPRLYAPVTGFYSLIYGATGLERTENRILNGRADIFAVDRIQQLVSGRQSVQSPSFDPNKLSSHDPAEIREYYNRLESDPDKPLLNRPVVALNPPGSTFKLVTAAAALASGRFNPNSVIPGPRTYRLPLSDKELRNWNRQQCGPGGQVTLRDALAISCNTAFAWLGNELGADAIRAQAQAFGFDTSFEIPLRAATSRFPENPDAPQTAMSAIGQFDVRATALQMAMVTAAIGNSGRTMRPYLIQEVRGPDLSILQTTEPEVFADAMRPSEALALTEMMVNTVENGTGTNARIPDVRVAGKTGTAQTGNDRPTVAWFVAFAPAAAPQVAVAVLVEDAGLEEVSGNGLGAPIAKDVIEAVLQRR